MTVATPRATRHVMKELLVLLLLSVKYLSLRVPVLHMSAVQHCAHTYNRGQRQVHDYCCISLSFLLHRKHIHVKLWKPVLNISINVYTQITGQQFAHYYDLLMQ